jgi:hypothetical protein
MLVSCVATVKQGGIIVKLRVTGAVPKFVYGSPSAELSAFYKVGVLVGNG